MQFKYRNTGHITQEGRMVFDNRKLFDNQVLSLRGEDFELLIICVLYNKMIFYICNALNTIHYEIKKLDTAIETNIISPLWVGFKAYWRRWHIFNIMKLISLGGFYGKGEFVMVDDEDFEFLNQFKWTAQIYFRKIYALRTVFSDELKIKTKTLRMHRVIMNCPKGLVVDHIDGNTLNNQKSNLRVCTQKENSRNTTSSFTSGSKYLGVSWNSRERIWRAQIRTNGKTTSLGGYSNEIPAALAYNDAAKRNYGEFANLNRVPIHLYCKYLNYEEFRIRRYRHTKQFLLTESTR